MLLATGPPRLGARLITQRIEGQSTSRLRTTAALSILLATAILLGVRAWARAQDVAEHAPLDEAADTLSAVRERGELWWGADAQGGAPFIFQDPRDPNRLIGFEVDLADAIAKQLGVTAHPVQGQWDKLLELLARGDFDVALNGIEASEEKLRVSLLSEPYYVAAERMTIRRGDASAPRSIDDVKGRRLGTLPGALAESILARAGAEVHTYDGGQDDIYKDLLLGRTDGVLLDDPITQYYGAIEPELEVVPGSFGEVRYAAAVRKGDDTMKNAIDAALAELAANGTLRAIYETWGLWNAETAALLGDPDVEPRGIAEAWEAWRAAVGKKPPFLQRVRHQYPAMMGIFAKAAAITLAVCILAMALAVVVGVLLAVLRSFAPRPLRWLATAYVELFRGTPLLVQLTMIYFGLPELGLTLTPFSAGVVALGLNYAAAESENYRAGFLSVPAAQLDAARVLGFSTPQALRFVVLPQAVRVSLPPMTNDFIALLKDSSLVSVVTLTELTKTYSILANSTRDHLGLGVVVAAWYLLIGLPFVMLSRRLERRLGAHIARTGGA
jgi:polar amino acid transport system substrate-binding protein